VSIYYDLYINVNILKLADVIYSFQLFNNPLPSKINFLVLKKYLFVQRDANNCHIFTVMRVFLFKKNVSLNIV